jgi:hypothetical protein
MLLRLRAPQARIHARLAHGNLTREQIRSEAAWREWLSGTRRAVP